MPELQDYEHYGGSFPTTAAIAGALAHEGVTAPHTGRPYTEALLMGIAGGAAFGYFVFAYEGYDPQVNILTRNTFHNYGWDPLTERLRLEQDVIHSTTEAAARGKLIETLEAGRAPVLWADVFSLGYESSDLGAGMWLMQPMVVTAYEPDGEALAADRSAVPIRIPAALLDEARGKVKKEKHRLVTLEAPDEPDLAAAVRAGIRDAVELFSGKPPRGSANNFGTRAYDRWITALRKPTSKGGWTTSFPPGRPLFAGLTSAFRYALQFWEDDSRTADRELFASFLEEAAIILNDRSLGSLAAEFRAAGALWHELGGLLLPDGVPLLCEARELLTERHERFLASGNRELDRLQEVDARMEELRRQADSELADPDTAMQVMTAVADGLEPIRDAEAEAFAHLAEVAG